MACYEPLRIVAHMRTNVVCDEWLPLDAIIHYQVCRDRWGPQVITTPGGDSGPSNPDPDMPFEVREPGDNWYYACSWAQPRRRWLAEGTDHWNKRFRTGLADLVDFGGRRGKVIVEKGKYKAYHMPVFYRVAKRIEWFAVGDKKRLEYLLATLTHFGKKRSQGWGRVSTWEVEPWPEDWSVRRGGLLTRGVPVFEMGSEPFEVMFYGLRPPYYNRYNQFPLAMPG